MGHWVDTDEVEVEVGADSLCGGEVNPFQDPVDGVRHISLHGLRTSSSSNSCAMLQ